MSRIPLFLILSFLAAVAMIGFAGRSLLPTKPAVVEAQNDKGILVFEGKALNHIVAAEGFPVTPAPGPRGDQTGPRLASESALAPGAKFSKGARLKLGPETLNAISGKPLTIVIYARGLPQSAASKMGFGVFSGGPVQWATANVSANFQAIRFEVPASATPISELAIWPSTTGQLQGIEIKSISIQTTQS